MCSPFVSLRYETKTSNMRTPAKSTRILSENKILRLLRSSERYRLRLARREQKIKFLEQENARLRGLSEPQPVCGHTYPAQMMAIAVFIVVCGGSLRLAAKTAGFYADLMAWSYGVPSHVTIRNWMMSCGLSVLNGGSKLSGQYTLIVDESVQIGKEKLLLLLGLPNRLHQSQCAALRHEDVEVLGMSVQTSWTGQKIAAFIDLRVRQLGIKLTGMLSDRGTNLLKACKIRQMAHLSDCSHWMMNGVKAIFKNDAELSTLCAEVGKLRQRLSMTDYAHLLPPTLRDKDRFCRIFQLTDWMDRVEIHVEQHEQQARQYLSFLSGTEALQLRLREVRHLVQISGQILRRCGLSKTSYELWKQRTQAYLHEQGGGSQAARAFVLHMQTYFDLHRKWYEDGQRYICCSEVIESYFGKYKNKGGMKVISADVLCMSLYGQKLNVRQVKQMMENSSVEKVRKWKKQHIAMNRYGILHQLRQEQKVRTPDG